MCKRALTLSSPACEKTEVILRNLFFSLFRNSSYRLQILCKSLVFKSIWNPFFAIIYLVGYMTTSSWPLVKWCRDLAFKLDRPRLHAVAVFCYWNGGEWERGQCADLSFWLNWTATATWGTKKKVPPSVILMFLQLWGPILVQINSALFFVSEYRRATVVILKVMSKSWKRPENESFEHILSMSRAPFVLVSVFCNECYCFTGVAVLVSPPGA